MSAKTDLITCLPFLSDQHGEKAAENLLQSGYEVQLPGEQLLLSQGDNCTSIPFVLEGTVRVYALGESGREMTLYRIEPGSTCVLTISSVLGGHPFPAYAVTETQSRIILVPSPIFRKWVDEQPFWRQFAFSTISARLYGILCTIEDITFDRMDRRLARYILKYAETNSTKLPLTHQYIASELGTAREVISRLLKQFESQGIVSLARGEITVLDKKNLKNLSRA